MVSPDNTELRGLLDEELGPTPPAPADRLEWVLRAASSNEPPITVGRVPRRGYLALAVALLSTSLIAGLVMDSRLGAGGRAAGNSGDTDAVVVTGAPTPTGHRVAARPGPTTSAPPRRSLHGSAPAVAAARPRPTPAHPGATHRPAHGHPTANPTPPGSTPPWSTQPGPTPPSPTATGTSPTTGSPSPTPSVSGTPPPPTSTAPERDRPVIRPGWPTPRADPASAG